MKIYSSGYSEAGASVTKRALRAYNPDSGSAARDIDRNNNRLRQRARVLYMASPVATSAINTNRTKVIGSGLTLKVAVDRETLNLSPEEAAAWSRQTEREFSLWANDRRACDALGLSTFSSLQQLFFKSQDLSGDVFALIKREKPSDRYPYTMRLHLIEADRVSTPPEYSGDATGNQTEGVVPAGKPGGGHKIHDGVEVDGSGRVVAYYVSDGYPKQPIPTALTWTRVLAVGDKTGLPNVIHGMSAERPDQYRGVPFLAPVIEPLLQLRRYSESQLTAAIVQSFFSAWIVTETDTSEFPLNEVGEGEGPSEPVSQSPNEYEMGPGTVTHLKPGEQIVFGNPNVPAAPFETFVKTLCRMVGAALEIPYDVLLKEFDSSYSASRGALLEAWEAFKMRRAWFIDGFLTPVYETWLTEAVAIGRVRAPGFLSDPAVRAAWCGARWIGGTQGSLDPKKEAAAALMLASAGIKTYSQIARELGGGDFGENVEILREENEALRAAGALIYADRNPLNDDDGDDGQTAVSGTRE